MSDPILAEVRRIRRELFAECGLDLQRYFELLREQETKHPHRLITKDQLDARRRGAKAAAT